MATNLVYRNTDSQNRVEDLGETIAPGAPVLSAAGLPAVAVTGSADYTVTESAPEGSVYNWSFTRPAGGASLVGQEVTLAFDGTWEFETADITGVTASTAHGTAVYITDAGALTATEGTNTLFGYVDLPPQYDRSRGFTPIRIGA